jgi:hypothetical protein
MMRVSTKRVVAARARVMAMRVVGNKENKGRKVMARATKVACNKEGNVDCSKSTGNKDGGQATAMREMATATPTTWVMATATRLAGDKEGKAEDSKGNVNGHESGMQQRGQGWQGNGDGNKGDGASQNRKRLVLNYLSKLKNTT